MQLNRECSNLNDSDLENASPPEANNRLLRGMNARISQLSMIEQFASLGQEQEENALSLKQVEP
jgi:hypothetical protein